MNAKERNKRAILQYLSDGANPWPKRGVLATKVCGYADTRWFYRLFSVEDLAEIEQEALRVRRRGYSKYLAQVDLAVLKKAATEGDSKAARLAYERFEGWQKDSKAEGQDAPEDMAYKMREAARLMEEKEHGTNA